MAGIQIKLILKLQLTPLSSLTEMQTINANQIIKIQHRVFSIKKGKLDEAEQSLLKVFGPDYDAKQDVINISDNLQHLRKVPQSHDCTISLELSSQRILSRMLSSIHFTIGDVMRTGSAQEK